MKKNNILYHKVASFIFLYFLIGNGLFAQSGNQVQVEKMENYTVEQCVEFALENSVNVANARLSHHADIAKVGEVKAQGLPQANVNLNLIDNYKVPTSFIPEIFFNPNAGEGDFVPVQFTTQYNGSVGLSVTQLLFDGSFFLGLKAARTFTELSEKKITQTEIQTKEAVSKAFYGVLISQEKFKLLEQNEKQLDTLLFQTQQMYKNGFVEQIDVSRIEVSSNNIKAQKISTQRILNLSMGLLKFQMSLPPNANLTLSGTLKDVNLTENNDFNVDPANRIEYSMLETQKKLNINKLQYIRTGYMPTLKMSFNYGSNTGVGTAGDLFRYNKNWFANGSIGLHLSIPVFDGFRKKFQSQQARFDLEKTENTMTKFENIMQHEVYTYAAQIKNGMENLKIQERNMKLANEVYRVTKIKYAQGVGSNLEILNAETSQREAETNYFSALYDTILNKISLDKALGKL